MPSPFSSNTLSFLRSLKRHNDRDWFRLHKDQYETHVREPMIALLERLAGDLRRFAPELVCDPRVSLYRIYRDTRFSPDKTPLKTHVAARFPAKGMARGEGAVLYLHIAPDEVWVGGGAYMPASQDLRLIREHVSTHHDVLRRIVRSAKFRREVGSLTGEQLSSMPRGYRKDHPAADVLRLTQFLAGREFEPAFATNDRFYPAVVSVFQAVAPLVRFLNTPLIEARRGGSPPRWT
jgi:uncharacterized protein (TIGR02453 family)